jgi:Mg-chelatase subunit ChlD
MGAARRAVSFRIVERGSLPRGFGLPLLALAGLLAASAPTAAEELPAVARPRFALPAGGESGSGTAFFLALPGGGVAGVAPAHSFDLPELAGAVAVEFRLGRTGTTVARSAAFLAAPGRPFQEAGSSVREDLVLFALDGPPAGARVLEPAAPEEARAGERVRLLGVPAMVPQDEDDLFGHVVSADSDLIEVDLDVPADLRGWGGAPVLSERSGRVLGILEAAVASSGGYRLRIAPVGAALAAAAEPLGAGHGLPFSRFAEKPPAEAEPPQAAPAVSEEVLEPKGDFRAGRAADLAAESDLERKVDEAAAAAQPKPEKTRVQVDLAYPPEGAVMESTAGAFVAGNAIALQGELHRFDVIFVLDTSGSTGDPTGVDVNGNGVVGSGGLRGLFRMGSDPGDSILAAEVVAAERLLARFDPRNVRVGLVTFSGMPPDMIRIGGPPLPPALTEAPLTNEFDRVRYALGLVLQRGPDGQTHMAAGLDQATIELLGLRGALSEPDPKAKKVVVLLTDGFPTLPTGYQGYDVRACLRAADRAHRAGIQVNTFAIGPEALSGPVAVVEMAQRTGGRFTPVRQPGDIVSVIEGVSLVDLAEVRVRNLTTGKDASEVEVGPDGSFRGLVDLAAGRNEIEVVARASDGTEGRQVLHLQHAPGVREPELPAALVASRNDLLERRLANLKSVGLGIERQRAEQTRRGLALEIERERQQAEARAADQRRELKIEPEPADGTSPPSAQETP